MDKEIGLEAYKRSEESLEGVSIVLPRGVRAVVKEYGTTEFWKAYVSSLAEQETTIKEATPEQDNIATCKALANACIVSVADVIDKEEIYEILLDPVYWELRRDLTNECNKLSNFLDYQEKEAKKQLAII